ncbi:hypothetical protein ACFLZY_02915 [Patescibacteria group bacterium]
MFKKKPKALYRSLLKDAWRLTWQRKQFWVFGLFAAVISSGGVVDVLFRSFKRIETGRNLFENILNGSFIGYEIFGQYVQQLQLLDVGRVSITAALALIIIIGILFAAVVSQGALIIGLSKRQILTLKQAWQKGLSFFWPIFGLNILIKALSIIMIILSTLPLVLFITRATYQDALLFFALFLIFFPLVIIISIVSMIALIDIIKSKSHALDAIHTGLIYFKRHWLVTFELGVILFFITTIAGFLMFLILLLLSLPYTVLLVLTTITASHTLFILINALAFLLTVILILIFIALAATFQHACWLIFYERAVHKTRSLHLKAKLERLLHWL